MGDPRQTAASLRAWLVVGLLLALAGCAAGAGQGHHRPHAARDPAAAKLDGPPTTVARDEVARDEIAVAVAEDLASTESGIEEIVVTASRRETTTSLEPLAAAGPPRSDPAADRAVLLTEVDRILAGLPLGNAAFGVPPQMKVGERTTARLKLSLQESAATLAEEIRTLSPDAAAVLSDPLRVHTVMLARLAGTAGLEIRLLGGEEERTLDSATTEEWLWEITAAKPGAETLHLELFAVIEVQGEQRKNLRKSWDAVVTVEVPPDVPAPFWAGLVAWAGKNFQWLWAAILVPLCGLAYRTYQSRRRKPPAASVPEVSDHAD